MPLRFIDNAAFTSRVGIGTNNPTSPLHVFNAGYPQMALESNGGTWQVGVSTGNDLAFRRGTSGSNYPLWLDSSDNVGIGATSPSAKLHVAGTVKAGDSSTGISLGIQSTDEYRINGIDTGGAGWNSLHLRADGTDGLFIQKDTNNVGIGTTSPNSGMKLEVVGNIKTNVSNGKGFAITGTTGVTSGLVRSDGAGVALRTSDTDRVTVDLNGNVGIGTTSPGSKLQVNVGTDQNVAINSHNSVARISSYNDAVSASTPLKINGSDLRFDINSSEKMRINSSGNVGIGTTSPDAQLEISNPTSTNGGGGATLRLTRADATSVAGDPVGTIEFYSTDADGPKTTAYIKSMSEETYGRQGSLAFGVSQSINADATEAMRIALTGNVGIGETSPGFKLETTVAESAPSDFITPFSIKRSYATSSATDMYTGMVWRDVNTIQAGIYANRTNSASNYESDLNFYTNAGSSSMTPATALSTAKMTILAAGNVGIGTTSPGAKLDVNGEIRASSGLEISGGNINLIDNSRIRLGSSADFQIYHDGSNSYITDTGTGDLRIDTSKLRVRKSDGTETLIIATENAGVELFYDDNKKFETTSTGIEVEGNIIGSGGATFTGQITTDYGLSLTNGATDFLLYNNTNENVLYMRDMTNGQMLTNWTPTTFRVYQNLLVNGTSTLTGNVGIGTTSPSQALEVNGIIKISNTYKQYLLQSHNTYGNLLLQQSGAATIPLTVNSANLGIGVGNISLQSALNVNGGIAAGSYYNTAAPANGMIISGNVGVGTTSPQAKLEVASGDLIINNSGGKIDFRNGSGSSRYFLELANSNADLQINDRTGAGSVSMTIQSGGNVGIGTTSPATNLMVYDTVSEDPAAPGSATTGMFALNSSGQATLSIGKNSGNTFWISNVNRAFAGPYYYDIALNPLGGNVGIGTTSPGNFTGLSFSEPILDVAGILQSRTGNIALGGTSYRKAALMTSTGTDAPYLDLRVGDSGTSSSTTTRMRIDSAGNVGIGTASPSEKLDVNGNVKADSYGTFGDVAARVFAPAGAGYNGSSSETGYLIIKLPDNAASGVNNMMTGVIKVFDYSSNETFYVNFAGYWYSGYNWTNTSAWITSSSVSDRNFTIRFGKMNGASGIQDRPFITIGESASTWSYPKFQVIEYTSGHSNAELEKWNSGWDADISATLPGTSLRSVSNAQVTNWARSGQNIYYGSGTGNVGIGTTNPGAKLHSVETTSGEGLRVDGAGSGFALIVNGGSSYQTMMKNTSIGNTYASSTAPTNGLIVEGNVGIGTTNPATALEVNGTITSTGVLTAYTSIPSINIGHNGSSAFIAATSGSGANTPISFSVGNNNEKMRITSTGNVGIGTSSPGYKLSISAPSSSQLEIINSANSKSWRPNVNGNDFYITETGVSNPFVIQAGGNVGIGTTTPNAKLQVAGDFRLGDGAYTSIDFNADPSSHQGNGGLEIKPSTVPGSGTANWYTRFASNVATGTTNHNVTIDGNVGIGTNNPSSKLHVTGQIRAYDSTNTYYANITANSTWGYFDTNATKVYIAKEVRVDTGLIGSYDEALQLRTSGTTRMYINDSTGNVGIGTTLPSQKLQIFESGNSAYKSYTSTNAGAILTSYQSQGNPYTKTTDLVAASDGTVPSEIRLLTRTNGSSTVDERMRIDSSGNVGIGTTNPAAPLTVQAGTNARAIRVLGRASDEIAEIDFYLNNNTTLQSRLESFSTSFNINTYPSIPITFKTANTERMRITSGGNVGIGTTNPSAKLEVVGSGSRAGDTTLHLKLPTGNVTAGITEMGNILFSSSDASGGGTGSVAKISTIAGDGTNAWVGGGRPTDMAFFTQPIGAGATLVEAMRIDQDGNVGIGTTSPGSKLDVNSGISSSSTDVIKLSQATTGAVKAAASLGISIQNSGEATNAADLWFTTASGGYTTERMRITSSGNVGIGTTSPSDTNGYSRALDIVGANGAASYFRDGTDVNKYLLAGFIGNGADNGVIGTWGTGTNLRIFTSGSERMRIDSSGNVGIGTTSPNRLFQVEGGIASFQSSGDSAAILLYPTTSKNLIYSRAGNTTTTGKPLGFVMGNSEAVTIDTTGNVGIGTTSPQQKLDVVGYTRTTTLEANGLTGSINLGYGANFKGGLFNDQYLTGDPANSVNDFVTYAPYKYHITVGSDVENKVITVDSSNNVDINGNIHVVGETRLDSGGGTQPGVLPNQTPLDAIVRFGGAPEIYLSEPDEWLTINIGGTDYVIPAYLP